MKKHSSNIKLIIFDLDGTLVDAFGAVTRSLNYMFRQLGYPHMTREEVKRRVGWGETALVRAFVDEKDLKKAITIYRKHHKNALKKGVKFLPGAKQLLLFLRKKGCRLAIASNRPTRFTKIILRELGIARLFGAVVCADQEGVRKKPYPDILKKILKDFDVRPREAAYVGDMTIDVQAGKRARVKTIAVATGSSYYQEIVAQQPDYVAHRISDVPKFLDIH